MFFPSRFAVIGSMEVRSIIGSLKPSKVVVFFSVLPIKQSLSTFIYSV